MGNRKHKLDRYSQHLGSDYCQEDNTVDDQNCSVYHSCAQS